MKLFFQNGRIDLLKRPILQNGLGGVFAGGQGKIYPFVRQAVTPAAGVAHQQDVRMEGVVQLRGNKGAQRLGLFYAEGSQHPGKLFAGGVFLAVAGNVAVLVGEKIIVAVFVLARQFKAYLVGPRPLIILLEDEHPGLAVRVQVLAHAAACAIGPHQIAAANGFSGT